MFKFGLGAKVKDKLTGFVGYVMCRSQYITGCDQYSLLSVNKKEAIADRKEKWLAFDENRLKIFGKSISIESKTKPKKKRKPGGPQVYTPTGSGR